MRAFLLAFRGKCRERDARLPGQKGHFYIVNELRCQCFSLSELLAIPRTGRRALMYLHRVLEKSERDASKAAVLRLIERCLLRSFTSSKGRINCQSMTCIGSDDARVSV